MSVRQHALALCLCLVERAFAEFAPFRATHRRCNWDAIICPRGSFVVRCTPTLPTSKPTVLHSLSATMPRCGHAVAATPSIARMLPRLRHQQAVPRSRLAQDIYLQGISGLTAQPQSQEILHVQDLWPMALASAFPSCHHVL
ncbi:hypothetical protein DFH08DRAFT_908277 [Mycena albidolilacea]|uniref:Secreted protein n=1 Tax=Mycena albidolilacea TaxID=1033008 RepID=A0AAD6YWJ4_9AGAR|nr:hypothetical protein DFH08DRAFT_908277 [Mycena albidolilacea]